MMDVVVADKSQPVELTPRTTAGRRLRLHVSWQDLERVLERVREGKGRRWTATVKDVRTGIHWKLRGASCGLPRCFCDAIAYAKRHPLCLWQDAEP